jgi:hypothetical protein
MSANAPIRTPVKTPAVPPPVHTGLSPQVEPERQAEREACLPDLTAQMESAARLGHNLGAISVSNAVPIIQRQMPPQEDEEEELQMQREPAALQRQQIAEEEEEELQRQAVPEEEEELQMKRDDQRVGVEGGKVLPAVESAINRARGVGQPLDSAVQTQMGERLGHDFSAVRVHTDAQAHALNEQLSAKAFTTGRDIFFQRNAYDPASSWGRGLLAHELTHVVQQSIGLMHGDGGGMTTRAAGDAFEKEAEGLQCQTRIGDPIPYHPQGAIYRSVLQRSCWHLNQEHADSFIEGEDDLIHPFGAPGGQYFRLQPDANPTRSVYYGVWTPKYEQVSADGKVDMNERRELAVLRSWVPEWHYLVKYRGGMNGYFGRTQRQADEQGKIYQGGALQVLFPTTGGLKPEKVDAYPVEEKVEAG